MAHRDIKTKQVNRLRKALRRSPGTPRGPELMLDPVQWILDRRLAQTAGEARRIILDGRLKAGSHTMGIKESYIFDPTSPAGVKLDLDSGEPIKQKVVALVPAKLRRELIVIGASG